MIRGDIRDLATCRAACAGVDYVLHQAALGSVPRSLDDPVTSNQVNVDGTLNMFIAAREAGVRRVVYASSCAVYGDSEELPLSEDLSQSSVVALRGDEGGERDVCDGVRALVRLQRSLDFGTSIFSVGVRTPTAPMRP